MLFEKIFCYIQYVTPQHLLSRLLGRLMESRIPWIKNTLIRFFIDIFAVDMTEAEHEAPEDYAHFNDFFTRPLKKGARLIEAGDNRIISPCDGTLSEAGPIDLGSIMQAKGQHYSLMSLLAGNVDQCNRFLGGSFMTIYLSPKDYHRIHMPVDGQLLSMTYVPGKLFSVNQATANHVPGLFARNERLICEFETEKGPMIMILVGAMIVAAIETVWAGQVAPLRRRIQETDYTDIHPVLLKQGNEMGRFKLGSTVILLFPEQAGSFQTDLTSGDTLRLGQAIGQL